MKRLFTAFPALGLSLLAASWNANGAELPRLRFSYGDWEIACDNTRTCRAAGYDSENSSDAGNNDGAGQRRMSVLLTRKAGPDTLVHAELQIGTYEDTQPAAPLPRTLSLTMTIDGKEHGKIAVTEDNPTVDLAPGQTQALLAGVDGRPVYLAPVRRRRRRGPAQDGRVPGPRRHPRRAGAQGRQA